MKTLISIFVVLFSTNVFAISTTDKLSFDETEFYNQSSGTKLISCAIEYFGMDNNLNILNGSLGLSLFEDVDQVPVMFKLKHYSVNTDGTKKSSIPIEEAWFELNDYISNDLKAVKNDEGSFLSIGGGVSFVAQALAINYDQEPILKIIVSYKQGGIDKVFEFSSLTNQKLEELLMCSLKMLQ